jgi:hypothetical protein
MPVYSTRSTKFKLRHYQTIFSIDARLLRRGALFQCFFALARSASDLFVGAYAGYPAAVIALRPVDDGDRPAPSLMTAALPMSPDAVSLLQS